MLNFYFLEKDLGIVSLPHFVCDFLRKMFLMLYSINQILSPDCLYFLVIDKYMYCKCLLTRL